MTAAVPYRAALLTRVAEERELIEVFSGETRDQIIIIRDVVTALRDTDAKEITVEMVNKNWSMNVRARR